VLSPLIKVRNVYLLINYGDYVDGATTKASPYVQLLSTTNPASAHLDFINVRLNGTDTTGSQVFVAAPSSSANDLDGVHKSSDHAKKTATIVGAVTGTVFLVAVCAIMFFMYRRRQRKRLVPATDFSTANAGSVFYDTAYRPLLLPAPPGELHPVLGYHDEAGHAWARDFHPEDLYAPFAPSHGEGHVTPLSRYEEADPRNTR
jgi:hypothetical protein